MLGMKIIGAFIKNGYVYDDHRKSFTKNIEIKPHLCHWQQGLYDIPEKLQRFKIKNLHLDLNVFCKDLNTFSLHGGECSHPNVLNNHVCVGQLAETWRGLVKNIAHATEQQFIDFVASVETTLSTINYDSAYYQPEGELLKHLQKCKNEGLGGMKVGSGIVSTSTMRKI
jgi:hypothetical protein